jgi:hypothetical protein
LILLSPKGLHWLLLLQKMHVLKLLLNWYIERIRLYIAYTSQN